MAVEVPIVAPVEVVGQRRTPLQEAWRRFRRNRLALVGGALALLVLVMALAAPIISPYDPTTTRPYDKMLPPSGRFLMGADNLGRDILTRVIYGAQVSVQVGVMVVLVGALVGVPLGAIAGYKSGTILDEVVMRAMDVLMAFPPLVLAIAVMGAMGPKSVSIGWFELSNLGKIMAVIGIVLAPLFARVARAAVLKETTEQYVEAARCFGMSEQRILFGEILPNILAPVTVQATYYMATAILTEAALSFLGIGIQPPTPSWGQMLSEARGYLISGEWWFSIFPGLAILITMIGFNLLGDGLRDALDPRVAEDR